MPNIDRRTKGRRKKITKAQKKKLSEAMKGNKNAVGAESGRPSEYTAKIGKSVYGLLLMMYPIEKICEALEIPTSTFYRWRDEIPEFREIIYQAKYGADQEVVISLKRKAVGFVKKAVKPIKIKDEKTGADKIINHVYKEYHPPDTRAIEIYLRNRDNTKAKWSNLPAEDTPPQSPTLTINNNTIDITKLSDSAIKEILRAIESGKSKG